MAPTDKPQPEVPALLVPLIAAAAQVSFGVITDQLSGQVKRVRDRARVTSKTQITVDNSILLANSKPECLIFLRTTFNEHAQKVEKIGLALILQKKLRGDGFSLVPIYFEINNSAADGCGDQAEGQCISFGLLRPWSKALQAWEPRPQRSCSRRSRDSFSFDAVSIGSIFIDCINKIQCGKESAILAPPGTPLRGATISMSVVETGSAFVDIDPTQAELVALKAAIGPAISTAVTTGSNSIND